MMRFAMPVEPPQTLLEQASGCKLAVVIGGASASLIEYKKKFFLIVPNQSTDRALGMDAGAAKKSSF